MRDTRDEWVITTLDFPDCPAPALHCAQNETEVAVSPACPASPACGDTRLQPRSQDAPDGGVHCPRRWPGTNATRCWLHSTQYRSTRPHACAFPFGQQGAEKYSVAMCICGPFHRTAPCQTPSLASLLLPASVPTSSVWFGQSQKHAQYVCMQTGQEGDQARNG